MYAVGDVVYVISNKKRNVVPVQIVEQIVRRSLQGETVSFKASLPGRDRSKTIDLGEIDGTVHKTLGDARKFLYDQASVAINALLNTAGEVSKNHFGVDPDVKVSTEPVPQEQTADKNPAFDLDLDLHQQVPLAPPAPSNGEGNILDFTAVDASGKVEVQMPDGTFANIQMPEMQ
ncbi:MAG: hypothetical protein CML56_00940 [Rhodobacteraceae bacterium]|nr:hypothetical protein [Paracoccaceae bacterium]